MEDIPEPAGRPQRRADQDRARRRSAAPTCTSTTGTRGRRRPSRCRWPSATSTSGAIVEIGSEVRGLQGRRPRLAAKAHHLRLLPQLPRGQRHLAATPWASASTGRAASPSTSSIPAVNAFKLPTSITDDIASILDPFGNATHTALAFNMVGEDVLITGAGPIGIMAAAIARTSARATWSSPTSTTTASSSRGRWARRARSTSRTRSLDDVMKELGMQEGFDVGLEMSGNAAAFRDMLRDHAPRRQRRDPRHSARRDRRSTGTR